MAEPKYHGMPPTERTFTIHPYRPIICGGKCRDNYDRIETQPYGTNGRLTATLQRGAMTSFLEASAAVKRETGHEIALTGSIRTCAQQTALYAKEPGRFAPPDLTFHTRGLAIDVSTEQDDQDTIAKALTRRGWFRARPADEPWHWSFGGLG